VATILLAVSGGIAAYKSIELASSLRRAGHTLRVVMSSSACRFVTPLTFEAIARQPVAVDLWDDRTVGGIAHIELGRGIDLAVVCPATADVLARMRAGLADDLLGTTLLAVDAPVLVVPAMNPRMWAHPATQDNLACLRSRGVHVVEPEVGEMACGDTGEGRLASLERIIAAVERLSGNRRDLAGRHILISAGGTKEALDPVRFLGNRSSGRMGHALAEDAAQRGAHVTLVTTSSLSAVGCQRIKVESAEEMRSAMLAAQGGADWVVMCAAVADYRPKAMLSRKRKKDGANWLLELVPTPDILTELGTNRLPGQLLVGFAAETGDVAAAAIAKCRRKGVDLIIANDVSRPGSGFDVETNEVVIFDRDGQRLSLPLLSKGEAATRIWHFLSEWADDARARLAGHSESLASD
jgi:phosphopantothenoylcysteine decarboxylase/phosphopantothenate--cysteine ligase